MIKAKTIIPIQPAPIQCSKPYNSGDFNRSCIQRRKERMKSRNKDPDFCDRWAKYIIEGECLCAIHAKTAALEVLLREETDDE